MIADLLTKKSGKIADRSKIFSNFAKGKVSSVMSQ